MGIADARAIHPSIEIIEAEPSVDRELLESIADWCDRYTPLVAIDGLEGLFLDITGCAHLFGGEGRLLHDILSRLLGQGFDARAGIASTPGAAWAAARFHGNKIVPHGDEADLIAPLPLAALRLDSALCTKLEGVGLRTAGALMTTPRAPLVRRFGKIVTYRLDQVTGEIEEAISPRLPVPELSVERHFAEPLGTMEGVEVTISRLAETLKQDLERRGKGAERLQLLLFRVDGAVSRIALGTSRPLRDPAIVVRLFRERLSTLQNTLDVGYGLDLIRLSALTVGDLDPVQASLTETSDDYETDLVVFADRINARLGPDALLRPTLVESHIPERAVALKSFATEPSVSNTDYAPERPLRLLDRPDPVEILSEVELSFRWRRTTYTIVRSEGPERVVPEWWRDDPSACVRDYFRVEDDEGHRYWLFRERPNELQAAPRWFMHGLSA